MTETPTDEPARSARNDASSDAPRLFTHPAWTRSLPWLVNGITAGADMSLFGSAAARDVVPRWLRLHDALGCDSVVHARQVHEAAVLDHRDALPGLRIAGDADGHVTARAGVLLAVSVADCVPIFVASPRARAVALLHGGWRGVVAGILERGIAMLQERYDAVADDLHVHFGPAICGACFEVGPEVPRALGIEHGDDASAAAADAAGGSDGADGVGGDGGAGGGVRSDRSHVDLRAALAGRAIALGVPAAQVSISSFCTRCSDSPFFSHRAGCRERQIGVLAIRQA